MSEEQRDSDGDLSMSAGDEKAPDHAGKTIGADLVLALCARYMLEPCVGDSGLWNVLVRLRDGLVVNIDYEEYRGLPASGLAPAPAASKGASPRDHMQRFGVVLCNRGLGDERLDALTGAVRSDYFVREWTRLKAAAARQKFVAVSEKRVQQLDALIALVRK